MVPKKKKIQKQKDKLRGEPPTEQQMALCSNPIKRTIIAVNHRCSPAKLWTPSPLPRPGKPFPGKSCGGAHPAWRTSRSECYSQCLPWDSFWCRYRCSATQKEREIHSAAPRGFSNWGAGIKLKMEHRVILLPWMVLDVLKISGNALRFLVINIINKRKCG